MVTVHDVGELCERTIREYLPTRNDGDYPSHRGTIRHNLRVLRFVRRWIDQEQQWSGHPYEAWAQHTIVTYGGTQGTRLTLMEVRQRRIETQMEREARIRELAGLPF